MTRRPALRSIPRVRQQRGIALFIGLVFLVVLSLVAVIAMQSTLLEMRMVTNVARHAEAFQASESMRAVMTAPPDIGLFEQSLSQAGWPVSWGGTVPDADFDFSQLNPTLVGDLKTALGSPPKLLFGALDSGEVISDPSTWVTDATLTRTLGGETIAATLSVVPDGSGANAGAGAAQVAGYRGLGVGVASGGASRYFQIQSIGKAPSDGSNGRAVTIAQYKAIVK